MLVKRGSDWEKVALTEAPLVAKDQYNAVSFSPVEVRTADELGIRAVFGAAETATGGRCLRGAVRFTRAGLMGGGRS